MGDTRPSSAHDRVALVRRAGKWLGVAVVGAAVVWGVNQLLDLLAENATEAVRITAEPYDSIYFTEMLMAMPDGAPSTKSFSGDDCADVRNWLAEESGVDVQGPYISVVLQGATDKAVVIRDIRVDVVERLDPLEETYIGCSESAAYHETTDIVIDLDEEIPKARRLEPDGSLGEPYFADGTFTLDRGETWSLTLSAFTCTCHCKWTATIHMTVDGDPEELTLPLEGDAYETTAPRRPKRFLELVGTENGLRFDRLPSSAVGGGCRQSSES